MAEDCIVPGYLGSRSQVFQDRRLLEWSHQAWDVSIYGPKVIQDKNGLYRMYYTGFTAAMTEARVCVAFSSDLINWYKPRIWQHEYAGDGMANNILIQVAATPIEFRDIILDPNAHQNVQYLMTARNMVNGDNYLYIWDGEYLTPPASVAAPHVIRGVDGAANGGAGAHPGDVVDVKSTSWNPNHATRPGAGKYRRWYVQGQSTNLRSIGYYDCATLGGTYVNRGLIPEFTASLNWQQFYDFSHFYYKGSMWAVVSMYDSIAQTLGPIRLYRSEDHGNTWERSTDLLKISGEESWDRGVVTDGTPILVNGIWYLLYGGKIGLYNVTSGGAATPSQISPFLATAVENPAGKVLQQDRSNVDCIVPGNLTTRSQVLERKLDYTDINFVYNAWDESIYGPKVLVQPDGTYRMFYTAYAAGEYSQGHGIATATSTDLINWTKPNLGIHNFGGATGTNNNLILWFAGATTNNLQFLDCIIDPTTGLYVMGIRNDSSGTNYAMTSPDGITWTGFTGTGTNLTGSTGIVNGGTHSHPNAHVEGKAISYNPIRKTWRFWYNQGHYDPTGGDMGRRSIGFYEARYLKGPWVNKGLVAPFIARSRTEQFYDFSPFYYAGEMWAVVNMYNQNTLYLGVPMRLYRSKDHGDTWERSTDLLKQSAPGSWDYGLISDGCPLLVDGVWYFYYAGKIANHDTYTGEAGRIRLGLATAVENPAIADIKKINSVRVIGDGSGVPWGPE